MSLFGANIIGIVLKISFDLVKKRLHGREFWEETEEAVERLSAAHDMFKPAESDVPRTVGF